MRPTKVERIRGVNDVLPDDCAIARQLEAALIQHFESFGYRPIDLPLLEYTELYLKKAGEEIAGRLYDFTYRNRRLCLRPEITASAIRAYIDHLKAEPLPVRLHYSGPAFRYERPQRGRSRQFTQMGIELIGARGVMADAEAIAVACQGLDRIGLSHYRVAIGHIGVLAKFLNHLQLENRLQSFLLANMETLRKDSRAVVEARLGEIYPSFNQNHSHSQETSPASEASNLAKNGRSERFIDLFQEMDEAGARTVMLDLLDNMNIGLDGTREPAEIVDRLLMKMNRQDRTVQIEQALAFMSELGQLVGDPPTVLAEAEKLLSAYDIEQSGLEQLRNIINTLEFYPLDLANVCLDLGLSRGLQYYTGTVFEIHHGLQNDELQICGGGRYDDLIFAFGGKEQTSATGFSYGMERLRLALEREGKCKTKFQPVDILIVPVSQADYGYAIRVAETLRQAGLQVELDVRGRTVSSNFQYASKQNIPFAVVVGPEERATSEVVLKNMQDREQQRLPFDEVASQLNALKENQAINETSTPLNALKENHAV